MAPLTKHRTLILGLLLMMIVGLPALATAQDGTGVIYGTVTGPAGGVISSCEVTVQDTNLTAVTDLDGR